MYIFNIEIYTIFVVYYIFNNIYMFLNYIHIYIIKIGSVVGGRVHADLIDNIKYINEIKHTNHFNNTKDIKPLNHFNYVNKTFHIDKYIHINNNNIVHHADKLDRAGDAFIAKLTNMIDQWDYIFLVELAKIKFLVQSTYQLNRTFLIKLTNLFFDNINGFDDIKIYRIFEIDTFKILS